MKFCSYPLCARFDEKSKSYCSVICHEYHNDYLLTKKAGGFRVEKKDKKHKRKKKPIISWPELVSELQEMEREGVNFY